MKILFINSNRFKHPWPVIPIGLCSVASQVHDKGYYVDFLDLCFLKNTAKSISDKIIKFKPDIVGIAIRNIDNAGTDSNVFLLPEVKKDVIDPLKEIFNGTIVIGGSAVSISGLEMLEYFDLEYAIRGDGEDSILEFISCIEKRSDMGDVSGLICRKKGKIIINNPPALQSFSRLTAFFPYRFIDLAPYRKYNSPLQIQTKRGCPLKCIYCTYNNIEGYAYRLKSPVRVIDEIEYYVKNTGINHIEFTDSTFNLPIDHTKEILRAIVKKNLKLKLRTMGLNPAAIDEELVQLMKKANFREVDLGAEAMCDRMLKSLGKNFTVEDIKKGADLLHKYNIAINWYLLLGAPGEDFYSLKETFKNVASFAKGLDLVSIGVGIRIYKGAPISKRKELHLQEELSQNFLRPACYSPKELSLKHIRAITKQEALKRTNFFLFDEEETAPMFVLRFAVLLGNLFFPDKPIWLFVIAKNKIKKYLGISWIERKVHYRKNINLFHTVYRYQRREKRDPVMWRGVILEQFSAIIITNFSAGGIGVRSKRKIKVGNKFNINVTTHKEQKVACEFRAVWGFGDKYGFQLQGSKEKWQKFINDLDKDLSQKAFSFLPPEGVTEVI